MAKHTRIYTRTGDDGTTGLYSGARVPKNDPRIEAYGTVDELSSAIGVARATLRDVGSSAVSEDLASYHPERSEPSERSRGKHIDAWLAWTQDTLFKLGAELATPAGSTRSAPAVTTHDIVALERAIDESEATVAPLDTFIHPGGSLPGALFHLARTVCRRAERRLLTLKAHEPDVDPLTLQYLNRLSDALFVWARYVNAELSAPEHPWRKEAQPPPPRN